MSGELPNNDSASKSERSSFLSTLFRRSFSLQNPDDIVVDDETVNRRRTRGYSESSLDDFDFDQQDNTSEPKRITRHRSATEVDGNVSSMNMQGRGRPRSLTLSAMLLGPRLPATTEEPNKNNLLNSHELTGESNSILNENIADDSMPSRETSQTDHLNKKLLDSFLTRINSVAANIIDPSGRGENMGQVYTDDVMMDRILRRVESDKK